MAWHVYVVTCRGLVELHRWKASDVYRCNRSGLPRQAAQATSTSNAPILRAIGIEGLLSEFFSCRNWHKGIRRWTAGLDSQA